MKENLRVSTGSTLLDLAISGGRWKEGGIPGGILVEIYGSAGVGKTAVLLEICSYAQARGGKVKFLDPEARLDMEYSRIYGMNLNKEDYTRPDFVDEVFNEIRKWNPDGDFINVIACDSLAALSTKQEMEDEDKMGMRRAKEFSEGLRKIMRVIANNNWLLVCTNQIREGQSGKFTPGGKAIGFYASLRIEMKPAHPISQVVKMMKIEGKEYKKVIGIKSECIVKKSIIDDPYRSCYVYVIFGYGIDDIRGNLQWLKDNMKLTKYLAVDKEFVSMEKAIEYIEEMNYEDQLKEMVIDLWNKIEKGFTIKRKGKKR